MFLFLFFYVFSVLFFVLTIFFVCKLVVSLSVPTTLLRILLYTSDLLSVILSYLYFLCHVQYFLGINRAISLISKFCLLINATTHFIWKIWHGLRIFFKIFCCVRHWHKCTVFIKHRRNKSRRIVRSVRCTKNELSNPHYQRENREQFVND